MPTRPPSMSHLRCVLRWGLPRTRPQAASQQWAAKMGEAGSATRRQADRHCSRVCVGEVGRYQKAP